MTKIEHIWNQEQSIWIYIQYNKTRIIGINYQQFETSEKDNMKSYEEFKNGECSKKDPILSDFYNFMRTEFNAGFNVCEKIDFIIKVILSHKYMEALKKQHTL